MTVPAFHTKGAPASMTLGITWDYYMQFLGYDTFTGSIGAGRIFISTGKGVIFKGQIEGGPEIGQRFVGAGTWTSF